MVDIAKLNNIAAASIAKVDNIAVASIANIDGVVRPSASTDIFLVDSASNAVASSSTCTIDLSWISILEWDVVIAIFGQYDFTDNTLNCDADWYTELAELYAADTRDTNYAAYYKVQWATVDTSVTCTSNNSADSFIGIARVYRNVNNNAPIDATTTTATWVNGNVPDAPSITTVRDWAMVIASWVFTQVTWTPTIAYPSWYADGVSDSSGAGYLAVCDKLVTTAWAEDPWTITWWDWDASCSWCASTIALRPAPAPNWLLSWLQHYWKLDSDGTDAHWSIDLTATNITWNTTIFKWWTASAQGNWTSSSLANITSQTLGIANSWTIMCWFYPDSTDSTLQVILELRNWNTDLNNFVQVRKEATTKKLRIFLYDSSWNSMKDYTSTNALTDNAWNNIIITRDGTNLKYYINWTEDTTMTKGTDNSGTMTDSTRKITWGNDRYTTGTNEYKGELDECCRWDRVVDSGDISNLQTLFYDDFTS